ncbi:hypothetical protein J2S43_007857 [Catenuloplanes nepalensis]|uniref:IPT/TIG domain-containing protein n=1 Tax=Catenuloplanes nepalensis TaxID=587533 RepID=A0ABT9N6L8_9ACTN|nr:IPT/TIG domain-containing protein [Catenuloplanes nepalensis]MDP9799345.1 hypothetical protein [Catenuloplanes nepalensis]
MSTTPTTRVTALARRMRVDIDTAVYPAVSYQQLLGMQELKLIEELRTESDEGYDDEGAARESVTGYSWRLEAKILHSTNAAGTTIDPVQAFLRARFNAILSTGSVAAGEFGVRWYDRNGLEGDSKEGRAYIKAWPPDGGNSTALDTVSIVIQGQGRLSEITNPLATSTPAVSAVNPAGGPTAGGALVNVYGQKFTGAVGAAAVKFGATNAISWTLINDGHIVAVAPAGAAGTVQVAVTTPAGTSANTAADDFVYA